MSSKEKVGRGTQDIPWSFQDHPNRVQERIIEGGIEPLRQRPSFAYGVICQEIFAGGGSWTKAMHEAGLGTKEPVELYEDPLRQKGPRPEYDLKDPTIRQALLDEARAMPGPDCPNVYEFGVPCTSYCDFALLSGGTRTYQEPRGDPQHMTATEEDGNMFCDWTCEMCLAAHSNDKEFIIENSMPSGRYPKLWDQPAIQKLQKQTGAMIVPTHLCEWGLAPSDDPDKRYKKGQWNLVSPGLYAYALLLARRCGGRHEHVQLKGPAPSGSYPRTREAQVYPWKLCKAWAVVIQAAYFGWGPRNLLPKLQRLLHGNGRKGGALKPQHPKDVAIDASGLQAITENRARKHHCGMTPGEDEAAESEKEAGEDDAEVEITEDENGTEDEGREGRPEELAGGLCPYRLEYHQCTPEQLQAYYEDRRCTDGTPVGGDYWDYNADSGLLRRHHVVWRDRLFGHSDEDQPAWAGCCLRRAEIQESRRTVIIEPDGRLTCIYDSWAFPSDQTPEVARYPPWFGFTDFARHGTVHLGRPPQDHEEPYYLPPAVGGDEDEGAEEEEEEEEVPSTTETPGSDASTLRSRTPPRDVEERRVGYLKASPELELLFKAEWEDPKEAPVGSAEEAARAYVEHCTGGAPYGPHLIRRAVELGDQLLLIAGNLEIAMEELRKARKAKLGEPYAERLAKRCVNASPRTTSSTLRRWLRRAFQQGGSTPAGE